MELTSGQEIALQNIRDLQNRYLDGGGIGVISGYAGTGKTTLISVINDGWKDCIVVTPTGKASLRVKEATGARAMTIHRWMYSVVEDEDTGDISFRKKEIDLVEYPGPGFLIVDEASMLSFDVFKDLYEFCKRLQINLILIGDGFQLPPVEADVKKQAFSVFNDDFPAHFKVQLTEIHRQAQNSPIIRASMAVRNGRWVEESLSEVETVKPDDLTNEGHEVWSNEGVVICHKNATRNALNRSIRAKEHLELGPLQVGEPLLVTKNNYFYDIYNGEVLNILEPVKTLKHQVVRDRANNASTYVDFQTTEVVTPSGRKEILLGDKDVLGTLGEVSSYSVYRNAKDIIWEKDLKGQISFVNANLGYCLTNHKAQGSEWNDVLFVLESSVRLNSSEGRRFVYTGLTRAKKRVRICWY